MKQPETKVVAFTEWGGQKDIVALINSGDEARIGHGLSRLSALKFAERRLMKHVREVRKQIEKETKQKGKG